MHVGVCGNPCSPGLLDGGSVGGGERTQDGSSLSLVAFRMVPGGLLFRLGEGGPLTQGLASHRVLGMDTEGVWRMVDPCRGLRAV